VYTAPVNQCRQFIRTRSTSLERRNWTQLFCVKVRNRGLFLSRVVQNGKKRRQRDQWGISLSERKRATPLGSITARFQSLVFKTDEG